MRDWNELLVDNSVRRVDPTRREISNRIQGARISAKDASVSDLTIYGQFKGFYDAAMMWCELVLRAEGWVTQAGGHHEAAVTGFYHFLDNDVEQLAIFLDGCRKTRHNLRYDWEPTVVSDIEVEELAEAVIELETIVIAWIKEKHPQLLPDDLN